MPSYPNMTKVDLKPKRHHGFSVVLFILGTLFPPLAVAARFGIGGDFFLNLILTICGYIPGHVHNFYIQNVRNNKNKNRTPKWAVRYGLVNTSAMKKKEKKSQWANRFNDRNPHSTLQDQPYEDGQDDHGSSIGSREGDATPRAPPSDGRFWNEEEERYYGPGNGDSSSVQTGNSGGRWRYPANFDDTEVPTAKGTKKKKVKKDRFARTEDAYSLSEETTSRKKKSKKRRNKPSVDNTSVGSGSTDFQVPENPEGGGYYGDQGRDRPAGNGAIATEADIFSHEL